MSNDQPVYIMSDDTRRTIGKDAQRNNIAAAKLVADTIRSTLGPKGMDKMLVDSMNDVIITNDGVTILNEMQIEHPAAKMVVEVAKTQESEVGDGTTTAVIFAGELLKNAENLLDKGIHPTLIAKGYRIAASKSIDLLNELSEEITTGDNILLKKIAITAMTGKGAEIAKDKLADISVGAINYIVDMDGTIDIDNIKIEKIAGSQTNDSELIKGIVLDKERVHSNMPRLIENAKIALLNSPLEIKDTEIDAKIQITDPSQLQAFVEQEEKLLKKMVEQVAASGANVLFCQKGIDDFAQHYLSKRGIFTLRRVRESDMKKLARATGAKITNNLNELTDSELGLAGKVEEKKIGTESMTFITKCNNPKAVSILIRGATVHVIDEIERAIMDAIGDLATALKTKKVVAGAGSIEIELAKQLRIFANSLKGREQLAVQTFANSVEIIPRTLADNAGLDSIDILTELNVKHDAGEKWAGINVFEGKVTDAWEMGVIEPLKIKTQAISSASEVAELILRIDDIIAAGPGKDQQNPLPNYK
jgi:archaeal chaperonin